jgi:hypothetical protein
MTRKINEEAIWTEKSFGKQPNKKADKKAEKLSFRRNL